MSVWARAMTLPMIIETTATAANMLDQSLEMRPSPSKKMRRVTAKAAALLANGEERGDRRRGALIDVGHPHLERDDRHLEAEAGDEEDRREHEAGARPESAVRRTRRCRRDWCHR